MDKNVKMDKKTLEDTKDIVFVQLKVERQIDRCFEIAFFSVLIAPYRVHKIFLGIF